MEEKVSNTIDLDATKKNLKGDSSPLNVVLFQEIERYNALLILIKSALVDVQKGIKGLVVMSAELEETFKSMLEGVVPGSWKKVYPSQKPLAAWRAGCATSSSICTWNSQASASMAMLLPRAVAWSRAVRKPVGKENADIQKILGGECVTA